MLPPPLEQPVPANVVTVGWLAMHVPAMQLEPNAHWLSLLQLAAQAAAGQAPAPLQEAAMAMPFEQESTRQEVPSPG